MDLRVDVEKKRSDIAMALMELVEKSDFAETFLNNEKFYKAKRIDFKMDYFVSR